MSKKHKNRITPDETLQYLEDMGYSVRVMNDYQFRVSAPELTNDFYDWYHTSGKVVVNREDRSPAGLSEPAFTGKQLHHVIARAEDARVFEPIHG